MGTRQRLVYTDSNGDLQVIAERRGALGRADRITHLRRGVGYDYAKLHGSNQLFDSIPIGISNFQGSEPEIFLQDYQQGSWEDFARIWAEKGSEIQEQGETAVKFWGFDKFIGDKKVNIQNVSGTVIDVMQAGINDLPTGSNYVLDYPTDVTHPTVNDYTATGKFSNVFQDMFDKYGYAIDVLPETDGSGNYKARFEPIGYGGAVDDVDTSEGDVIRRWNNKDMGRVVNSVTVIGKDSNNNEVVHEETDQASIDEYGEHVHPQNPIHVDYTITSSEAQTIAQNYMQPEPPSHGRARANLYESNVFNDSVQVIDSQRGINDTFTILAQKTYFDEDTATELDLDFEQEGLERKARGDESLWSERAKLYPSETQDVGNQNVQGDTQSDNADLARTQDVDASATSNDSKYNIQRASDTGVQGVETEQGYFFGNYNEDISGDNGSGWQPAFNYITLGTSYDYLFHACHISFFIEFDPSAGQTAIVDLFVRLYNRTTGEYFPTSEGIRIGGISGAHLPAEYNHIAPSGYLHAPFNWTGDEIQLEYDINVGGSPSFLQLSYGYHGSRGHIHDDDIEVEDDEFNAKKPSVVFDTDPDANITSQPVFTDNGHFHVIDTTTDTKNLSFISEDDVNRG